MILILACRWDEGARALALRWKDHAAAVLTARDLSSPGWRQRFARRDDGTDPAMIVVDGKSIPQSDVTAVLTRTPCIHYQELSAIAPEDRLYVASEMTAFLLFWLSRLPCPVLNRPTPTSLAGPHWRQERWTRAAAQSGIPVEPYRRISTPTTPEPTSPPSTHAITLTVIGNQVLGDAHSSLHAHARTLAQHAEVELLAVRFSSPQPNAQFLDASLFPDLAEPALADAALAHLQAASGNRQ